MHPQNNCLLNKRISRKISYQLNNNFFRSHKENVNIQIESKVSNEVPVKRLLKCSILNDPYNPNFKSFADLKPKTTTRATLSHKDILCEPNKYFSAIHIPAITDLERQNLNAIKEYGHEIDEYEKVLEDKCPVNNCLEYHEITPELRAKMIDWMVEVMTSFKCNDQTFFMSVSLMDRYLKLKSKKMFIGDLHAIGVASMFLASKYEDILPLRMEVMVKKIAHNKLSAKIIREYEYDILSTLDYFLQIPTSLEFLTRYLKGLENDLKDEKIILKKMSIYLLKLISHDYAFCGIKISKMAISSIYVALKIVEQLKRQPMVNSEIVKKMIEVSKYSETEILECAQSILKDAQTFDTLFPELANLKKTHFSKLMEYLSK